MINVALLDNQSILFLSAPVRIAATMRRHREAWSGEEWLHSIWWSQHLNSESCASKSPLNRLGYFEWTASVGREIFLKRGWMATCQGCFRCGFSAFARVGLIGPWGPFQFYSSVILLRWKPFVSLIQENVLQILYLPFPDFLQAPLQSFGRMLWKGIWWNLWAFLPCVAWRNLANVC